MAYNGELTKQAEEVEWMGELRNVYKVTKLVCGKYSGSRNIPYETNRSTSLPPTTTGRHDGWTFQGSPQQTNRRGDWDTRSWRGPKHWNQTTKTRRDFRCHQVPEESQGIRKRLNYSGCLCDHNKYPAAIFNTMEPKENPLWREARQQRHYHTLLYIIALSYYHRYFVFNALRVFLMYLLCQANENKWSLLRNLFHLLKTMMAKLTADWLVEITKFGIIHPTTQKSMTKLIVLAFPC